MAYIKNFTHGTLAIADGTGTPISLTVDCANGDFSISGLTETLREVAAYECRGTLISIAHTNRTYPTFSLTAKMAELTLASGGTILDAVRKTGAFSSAVSTSANSEVYTLKVTLTIEGTDFGDASDHVIVLDDCHCSADFSEGDPNQFSISGTVYGTVTIS